MQLLGKLLNTVFFVTNRVALFALGKQIRRTAAFWLSRVVIFLTVSVRSVLKTEE